MNAQQSVIFFETFCDDLNLSSCEPVIGKVHVYQPSVCREARLRQSIVLIHFDIYLADRPAVSRKIGHGRFSKIDIVHVPHARAAGFPAACGAINIHGGA